MRGLTAEEAYLLEMCRPGAISTLYDVPPEQWEIVKRTLYPRLISFSTYERPGYVIAHTTTQGLLALRLYYELHAMSMMKRTG